MPPKKKVEEDGVVTRPMLVSNYNKMCKSISVASNPKVVEAIRGSEDEQGGPLTQLILDESTGYLGAGGIRALSSALLGSGSNFTTDPYKTLTTIRCWKCDIGDEGAVVMASLLSTDMNIMFLEMMDCNVANDGCKALGEALTASPLMTLMMNYNSQIGGIGVKSLCSGLLSNSTLKQLHLEYCGIGPEGALALGQVVSMPTCAITKLSLKGNCIANGLKQLAKGVKRSKALEHLDISDNAIGSDIETFFELRDALIGCHTLSYVDIKFNPISVECAEALLPALSADNTTLKCFLVDSTLPEHLFEKLSRMQSADKGKKGKGKKKK